MTNLSLRDVREFNHSLKTIQAAGVALYFSSPASSGVVNSSIDCSSIESMTASLTAIEAIVTSAGISGQSALETLQQSVLVPHNYRQSLLLWHRTDHSPLAFEPLTAVARTKRREWSRLAVSLVQPLVAIALAYCCLAFICTFVAPIFEALSRQTQATPGPFLTALLWLRAWMPYWLLAIPAVFFLFASKPVWLWKRTPCSTRQKASSKRSMLAQAEMSGRASVALFADSLLAGGVSTTETIQWVRGTVCPNPDADQLPALMAWAITASAPDTAASLADKKLRRAAAVYGAAADAMDSRARNFIQPSVPLILFGGLLVLAVAMTVFGPLIEIMLSVARSQPSA